MGKFEITKVQLAPMQVRRGETRYHVYYNMTLRNTFTVSTLYVTATDELDAYYKANCEISELIDEREK